jgi:hypothetical protein
MSITHINLARYIAAKLMSVYIQLELSRSDLMTSRCELHVHSSQEAQIVSQNSVFIRFSRFNTKKK